MLLHFEYSEKKYAVPNGQTTVVAYAENNMFVRIGIGLIFFAVFREWSVMLLTRTYVRTKRLFLSKMSKSIFVVFLFLP